jgi:hypothetical protein
VATFKQELKKWQPRSSAIKTLLRRWVDDDRAEGVWKQVSAANATLTAEEFIRSVIRIAMAARALPARIEFSEREFSAVIASQRDKVAEAFASNRSLGEVAEILEDAAWELRFSEKFSMLDGYPSGAISRRRDRRSRKAFSLAMVDFFHQRCDKWMDGETGVLLEIMFPSSAGDSLQEVRDYRKSTGRLDRKKQA